MNPRTILAVLNSVEDMDRVLDCALPLANHFEAHLIGFHSEALPLPQASPMGFPDVELVQTSAEAARQRSQQMKQAFEERLRREGVSSQWHSAEGFSGAPAISAARAARAADLVITQQADPDLGSAPYADIEGLLFETGRPVLFVPYAMRVEPPFRRVLVAWNGTAEAARAAFDALPFIVAAEAPEIVCIDPRSTATEDAAVSGADLAAALARHGSKVTLANQVSAGLDPGDVLENHIADTGADLLVMGAYGHSWWREFFFGGVTRKLLQSMPAATLMSR